MRFRERVAVVTGGGRGIGRAVAERLASEGARVAICGTREDVLKRAAEEISKDGAEVFPVKADVSDPAAVEELAEAVLNRFGKADILVNNSGITRDNLLVRMGEEDWDRVLAVNLKGAFLVTKALIRPMMKARWGRIINITSVIGVRGNAGQANYAASKAGLIGFTKTVAREFASRGVTCNAVAPGFIETDMTRDLDAKAREGALSQVPLGFFGEPRDVAAVAAFLASEEARYVTGQVLCVDGGMVM